jgi:hypothetical protein
VSIRKTGQMDDILKLPVSRMAALFVVVLCFLSLVDAIVPQLGLYVFGQVVVREAAVKAVLFAVVVLGCLFFPRIRLAAGPIVLWLLCIAYLAVEIRHLTSARGMSFVDVLQSYAVYYLLLLIGPALLVFRGRISEDLIIRCTVFLLLICALVGIAQHVTARPILFTESTDGSFRVDSWNFFDQVRAFSLFTTALNFGIFCALCGALGLALFRTRRVLGALLFTVAAVASFTTLTRLSYLVFVCACSYSLVLTFGKKPARGLWQPLLYFALGISTIVVGLYTLINSNTSQLQDPSSLLERTGQWVYYWELIRQSSLADQLFGVGIVQNENILPRYPMLIDNLPLALVLHIGVVGLGIFGALLIKMWLYLRREALATHQPFVVAAASLWAALACAGIFNIVLSSFGAVFALAVLCRKEIRHV